MTVGLATHWPCVTDFVVYPPIGLMLMTHLPETRASNPALETRNVTCFPALIFISRGNLARYSAMLYSVLESGVNGAL